ncbi:MAG: NAD(P)H-hydrate epimerase [Gemmataceae bacterium]
MTPSLTREQARLLDRRATDEFGVPSLVLMENAGRSMAELLLSLGVHGPVAVACGKGNNGGDGLVLARHLDNAGHDVRVLLFAEPEGLSGDAAINLQICVKSGIDVLPSLADDRYQTVLTEAEWVVDALFGTGLQQELRPPFDRVIAAINASPARRFSVDLPSGMDADTGKPLGACVKANYTATVAAPKAGFGQPAAQRWLGRVRVVPLGAPRRLLAEFGL